jgi:hypothetical protein
MDQKPVTCCRRCGSPRWHQTFGDKTLRWAWKCGDCGQPYDANHLGPDIVEVREKRLSLRPLIGQEITFDLPLRAVDPDKRMWFSPRAGHDELVDRDPQ